MKNNRATRGNVHVQLVSLKRIDTSPEPDCTAQADDFALKYPGHDMHVFLALHMGGNTVAVQFLAEDRSFA